MKVVIDTNIIVSGLLSPYGNPAQILRLVLNSDLIICYDSRILVEYREVLNRPKFDFDKDKIFIVLNEITLNGELAIGVPLKKSLPDPDDNMFLEVAIASESDCIITGNTTHFPQELCCDMVVFSPSTFIQYYKEESI